MFCSKVAIVIGRCQVNGLILNIVLCKESEKVITCMVVSYYMIISYYITILSALTYFDLLNLIHAFNNKKNLINESGKMD